jgi:hypothetical protein
MEMVRAVTRIKIAAARANAELGVLDRKKADAIVAAAEEILAGKHDNQFVVDAYQAGAGTSFHMNVNEVIANRACELMGGKKGDYALVHPNDDVNMAQSTNDVIPTAMRLAAHALAGPLTQEMAALAASLDRKAQEFIETLKSGRTHLQDAVPITLGQEFSGYRDCVLGWRTSLERSREGLLALGLGGNAVGTGINAHPRYRERVVAELAKVTGTPFRSAPNLFEAMQSMAPFVRVSNDLRGFCLDLTRIANDLRLLASGPTTGFDEIVLPAVQPGSSIMPGKVNPVIAGVINMVPSQGYDATAPPAQGSRFPANDDGSRLNPCAASFLPPFAVYACGDGTTANRGGFCRYSSSCSLATCSFISGAQGGGRVGMRGREGPVGVWPGGRSPPQPRAIAVLPGGDDAPRRSGPRARRRRASRYSSNPSLRGSDACLFSMFPGCCRAGYDR